MNNIEKEKIRLRNEYSTRIKTISKEIFRLEESLTNLTRSGLSKDFVDKKKEENKLKIESLKNESQTLNLKLEDLDTGILDEEIERRLQSQKEVNNQKLKKENENRQQKLIDTENQKKAFSKRLDTDKKSNYDKRSLQFEIERTYQHYLRASEKCPDYIRKNLKEMPNNKGYIFNDVIFLGQKPKERENYEILFEKQRDGCLLIHEHFPYKTVVSKKQPNGRKEVIVNKQIQRIKFTDGNNIKYKL
jgi:hypothetical protein